MARKTRTSTSRRRKQAVPTISWAQLLAIDPITGKINGEGAPILERLAKLERRHEHYEQEMQRTNCDMRARLDEARAVEADLRQKLALLEESTGGLWRMQDGTLIQIRQMSDSHLQNAIRRFEGQGSVAASIAKMKAEQKRREVDRQWAERTSTGMQSTEKRLAAIETKLAKPVWDSKDQLHFDTIEQVGRLTRRLYDMEQENKKLRKPAEAALDVRLQVTAALNTIRRQVGIENIDVVRSLERLLDRVLP